LKRNVCVYEAEHCEKLQQIYDHLAKQLDAENVAAEMFQNFAISFKELESIQNCGGRIKAAEMLLNIVMKAPRETFECFLQALRHTHQQHVYLLIQCPGLCESSF